MRARHHYALHTAAIAAAVVAVVLGLVGVFTGNGRPSQPAPVTRADHVAAGLTAQHTPVIDCNPPIGAGRLGACAPHAAYQSIDTGGALLHDPYWDSASGLLIPDVSHYTDCPVNAAAMRRSGARALIAAAGDGPSFADPCLARNLAAARAAGLPTGAYLFLRPSPSASPEFQADRLAQLVAAAGGTSMPEWLDAEAGYGLSLPQMCSWEVRAALRLERDTHRVAGVYTGAWWADPNFGGCFALSRSPTYGPRPLWISGYALEPAIPVSWQPVRFLGGYRYALWQYTGDNQGPLYPHCLGGYCGIDISVFAGTAAQLAAFTRSAPPIPPVDPRFRFTCSELDALTWERRHHPRQFSRHQHQRAVTLRVDLRRHRVGCTAPPHSTAYSYPQRRGALA